MFRLKNNPLLPLVMLLIIVGVGLVIRLIRLDQLVLVHDEMSIGYNAYSVLETGKDEWGQSWPLVFKAFGDYKLPGYIYATAVSFVLFGANDFALKLPSLLSGLLIIVGVYWLVKELTSNLRTGLIAAVLVAVSPWPVHLSRLAIESNLATCSFVFGLLATVKLLKSDRKWKTWSLVLGISFAAAVYSYVALRLTTLLYAGALGAVVWRWRKSVKGFLLAGITFGILILPLLNQIISPAGTARFDQISIFSSDTAAMVVNEQRANCFIAKPSMAPVCKLLFNKPLTYLDQLVKNHNTFILPTFLFFEGGSSVYSTMTGQGEFLWLIWPFYLVGLVILWKNRKKPEWLILFLGWLIVVLPSSIAGSPQVIRGAALMPIAVVIISLGMEQAWCWLKDFKYGKFIVGAGLCVLIAFSFRLLINYWLIYPIQYNWQSYPLPKQTVLDVLAVSDNYDQVYFHNHFPDAHIALAWYGKFDPVWYQQSVVVPDTDAVGFQHPIELGKYKFGLKEPWDIICNPDLSQQSILYVSGRDDRVPAKLAKPYYDPSGTHMVAQTINLQVWREQLVSSNSLTSFCEDIDSFVN